MIWLIRHGSTYIFINMFIHIYIYIYKYRYPCIYLISLCKCGALFSTFFVLISGDAWWTTARPGTTSQDQQGRDTRSVQVYIWSGSSQIWWTQLHEPSNWGTSNLRCIDHLISHHPALSYIYIFISHFVTSEDACQGRALRNGSVWRTWNPLALTSRMMTLENLFLLKNPRMHWPQDVAWRARNDATCMQHHVISHGHWH